MKPTAAQRNRRIVKIATLFTLALVLAGCSKVRLPESELSFNAEYVRNDTVFGHRDSETVFLIDNYEECLDRLRDPDPLPPSTIKEGSTITRDEIAKRYTQSWFSDHQLIIAWSGEDSRAIKLKVANVRPSENGCMFVEVNRFNPVDHLEEIHYWQMLIEIDRCLDKETKFTLVFHNQE